MPSIELCRALRAVQNDSLHGLSVNRETIQSLLSGCTTFTDVTSARNLNSLIIQNGFGSDAPVCDHLIRLFTACGSLLEANVVFCSIEQPSVYTWHSVISAHSSCGESKRALGLFYDMQQDGIQPDKVIFLCILRTCGMLGILEEGKRIHRQVTGSGLASDLAIGSTLVDMYAKCGDQEEAMNVFEKLRDRDVVTWNAMLTGCLQGGDAKSALKLYDTMKADGVKPDRVTFLGLLKAYAIIKDIDNGYVIHSQITIQGLELDVSVGSALVDMYRKLERMEEADIVLGLAPNRNVISWNAIISGYAEQGNGSRALEMLEEMEDDGLVPDVASWNALITGFTQQGKSLFALSLFHRMRKEGVEPDKVSILCALKACTGIDTITSGMLIHDLVIRNGFVCEVSIGNTLIDMYARCGSLEEARSVFDWMSNRDTVSWNAMLAGYTQHEQGYPALQLFHKLQQEHAKFDHFTLSCVLNACAMVGAFVQGKLIHSQVLESNYEADLVLGGSLVDMYGTCGSMVDAEKIFLTLHNRDIIAWNAMIAGYTQHGFCGSAVQCLENMKQVGMNPLETTFMSILAACSHSGDMTLGWHLFNFMEEDHNITPAIQHFNCMVDLLGHCGRLAEAKELLRTMPVSPNATSWLSLLYAAKLHSDKELGQECFRQAVRLDSNVASGYVLMANMYASFNMWEDAIKLLKLKEYAEAHKKPGTAWIEVSQREHEFVVGSSTYPQCEEVNLKLKNVKGVLMSMGYVPQSGIMVESWSKLGTLSKQVEKPTSMQLGPLSATERATIRVPFVHQTFLNSYKNIKFSVSHAKCFNSPHVVHS